MARSTKSDDKKSQTGLRSMFRKSGKESGAESKAEAAPKKAPAKKAPAKKASAKKAPAKKAAAKKAPVKKEAAAKTAPQKTTAKKAPAKADQKSTAPGPATKPSPKGEPAAAPERAAAGAPAGLPIFYSAPHPVTHERHGGKSLQTNVGYGFAAQTNSVPLNAAEFPLAARHYPIVFTGSDPAMGLALLGLRDDENLFVGDDGVWQPNTYIPAYIRRYPFIFMAAGDQGRFILCIDEDAGHLADKGGEALFDGDKPTAVTDRALEFCKAYQQQSEITRQLGAILQKHDLLTANRANVTLKSGENLALGGFRMIDAAKFDALDDAVFLELRKAGVLPLIYAQLVSTTNWGSLVERDRDRH